MKRSCPEALAFLLLALYTYSLSAAGLGGVDSHAPASTHLDRLGDPLPEGAIARIGTSRLKPGGGEVATLLPTPDGKFLVSNNYFGEPDVCVWELPSGRLKYRRPGNGDVSHVGCSRDGKLLATFHNNDIWIWDLASGKRLKHWTAHTGPVVPGSAPPIIAVAFSPDGKLLASSGTDQKIRLWDTSGWQCVRSLPTGRPPGEFQDILLFSPDGKKLASAAWLYNRVSIWDAESGRQLYALNGDRGGIWSATFSPDGRQLLTGGAHGVIPVWDMHTGKRAESIKVAGNGVYTIAFAPGRKLLAGAVWRQGDVSIVLLDAKSGRELRRISGLTRDVRSLAFSPDGKTLFSGDNGGVIQLWDVDRATETTPTRGDRTVTALALSPSGDVLYSSSPRSGDAMTSQVVLSDTRTGREIARLQGSSPLALSADGRTLACAAEGTTVLLWDALKRTRSKSLPGRRLTKGAWSDARTLSFSASGRLLAVGQQEQLAGRMQGAVQIWDVDEAKVLDRFLWSESWDASAVLSPDGALVVASGAVNPPTIRVWDVPTGKDLSALTSRITEGIREEKVHQRDDGQDWPGGGVRASFSPNGRLLAVTAPDRFGVTLWEVSSGSRRLQLKGHTEPPTCAVFSTDGRIIASSGWDHTLRFWDVLTGEELQRRYTGHRGSVNAMAFSADDRLLATGADDATCLVWQAPQRTARATVRLEQATCERLWANLGDADASRAQQAIGELVR